MRDTIMAGDFGAKSGAYVELKEGHGARLNFYDGDIWRSADELRAMRDALSEAIFELETKSCES